MAPAVIDLLKKRLNCSPPCPYSFAASEVFRLHAFKLDRAQVCHWAMLHGYAHATPPKNLTLRFGAGSAPKLVNSGNWMPRLTLGFP